jgi:hypothetical protein
VPWQICLLAHALIHAGAYSLVLPLADACLLGWMHLLVDYSKSAGLLDRPRRGRLEGLPKGKGPESFWADQVLHVAFLVLAAWWAS